MVRSGATTAVAEGAIVVVTKAAGSVAAEDSEAGRAMAAAAVGAMEAVEREEAETVREVAGSVKAVAADIGMA